jgi:hypothetical protein
MTEQLDIFSSSMTDDESSVWTVVNRHPGRVNAIKVKAIANQVGFDERTVRDIAAHLVLNHGKVIGSSTGNPAGLYVITDPKELKTHIDSLKHRGIMCFARAAALNRSSIEDIFGQARLELEV